MPVVHFIEEKSVVLSQLLKTIPSVDESIKIKGRKGKVLSVDKVEENVVHVRIAFEKVVAKNQPTPTDNKKKKR